MHAQYVAQSVERMYTNVGVKLSASNVLSSVSPLVNGNARHVGWPSQRKIYKRCIGNNLATPISDSSPRQHLSRCAMLSPQRSASAATQSLPTSGSCILCVEVAIEDAYSAKQ